MDHGVTPRPPVVVENTRPIELSCNGCVRFAFDIELVEYPPDNRRLFVNSRSKQHAIRFERFVLSPWLALPSVAGSHQPIPCANQM